MIPTLNACICLYIIWKIVTYQRHGGRYKWLPSVIAYILCISAFWQVLRVISGHPACDSVFVGNAVIALSLHQYGGNVAKVIGYRYRKDGLSTVFRFSLRDWRL